MANKNSKKPTNTDGKYNAEQMSDSTKGAGAGRH
jgi:hypothetical protein